MYGGKGGRRLLVAVATALAMGPAAGQGESKVLEVERRVAVAIESAGSAELISSSAVIAGLAPDPAVRALAASLLARAKGTPSTATSRLLAVLRHRQPEASDEMTAALYRELLRVGPGSAGRAFLAEEGGPLRTAARAADLARRGRCEEALESARSVAAAMPLEAESRLLLAGAFSTCEQPVAALQILEPLVDGSHHTRTDLRVAIRVGELLLDAGDEDSAAYWCRIGRDLVGANEDLIRRSSICLASADAARGLLPSGRDTFIAAQRRALGRAELAKETRVRAGISAAWAALRRRQPAAAREALGMLESLRALRGDLEYRQGAAYLEAMALVTLERGPEARRVLATARLPRGAPAWLQVVAAISQSWSHRQLGDEVAASTALTQAAETARRSRLAALMSEVEMDRAVAAKQAGRRGAAHAHARAALESWPGPGLGEDEGAFLFDPALPRRALQLAMERSVGAGTTAEGREKARLEIAEQLRAALEPGLQLSGEAAPVRPLRVQRYLASRNAGLVYFLIGETRSFGWLLEPGSIRAIDLPSGDELLTALGGLVEGGSSPAAGRRAANLLLGGLVDSYAAEDGLMVCPDGFLSGLPWAALPPPEGMRLAERPARLDQMMDVSVVACLGAIVDPAGTRLREDRKEEGFVALVSRGLAGFPGVDFKVRGFSPAFALGPGPGLAGLARQKVRVHGGVVHLGLPLLAAGGRTGEVVMEALGDSENGLPAVLTLEDLFEVGRKSDLVAMAPSGGLSVTGVSRLRAAFRVVALGGRTALVPLSPMDEQQAGIFWPAFYRYLGRGESKAEALNRARGELLRHWGEHATEFSLVGYADAHVVSPVKETWFFWTFLGAGLGILAIVLIRALWPRRDPFDLEPPDEE